MEHERLLKNLIEIKSYSGQEDELRNYISEWFKNRSIESFTEDGNLIVHFEGKDTSRAFIFNSHMDTVDAGKKPWKYGAWTPTIEGDKLVGLGASDMKGGLAASMLLAEKISKAGKPETDLWFTYVTNEEVDGSGSEKFAKWFSDNGYPNKYLDVGGIFTEPTNLTEIQYGHRGNMFIKATSEGDSGHASRPKDSKRHSVKEMVKFANALQKEFRGWQKEFSGSEFAPPTVGVMTSIQAGVSAKNIDGKNIVEVDSPNKFPSVCVATFDVRTTPDFHKVAFERIGEFGSKMGVKIEFAFPPAPAGYTNPSEKIIKVTQEIVPNSKLVVSEGSADLGFLSVYGVKAIIFGPGINEQCHVLDEFTYLPQIPQAVDIYSQIVNAWAK